MILNLLWVACFAFVCLDYYMCMYRNMKMTRAGGITAALSIIYVLVYGWYMIGYGLAYIILG